MTRNRILKLALLAFLTVCLTAPAAFAAGGAKTHGSISAVTTYDDPWPDYSSTYFVRWVGEWKAVDGVNGKPDSGYMRVRKYNYADEYPFTNILDELIYQETWPVTNVTRLDQNTLQFSTPGWVYSPSESHYYSVGLYRAVGDSGSTGLYWLCGACDGEVWHSLGAQTKAHLNMPKVRLSE